MRIWCITIGNVFVLLFNRTYNVLMILIWL
jgi:hypothetical protein